MADLSPTPCVSIVVPCYNGAEYIRAAIESILSQTYRNIEIIVINDGSSDDSVDILKEYQENIYWESQTNRGQAASLNKGWEMAKGEILSYLSVDDFLEPEAVETAVNVLCMRPEIVLTYSDFNLVDSGSNKIRYVKAPDFSYYDLLVKQICQPGPGAFFKKSAFEKTGGWDPDYKQMPDYHYWVHLGMEGPFYRIPKCLAHYRVHEKSQTFGKTNYAKAEEPIRIISSFFENNALPEDIVKFKKKALINAHLFSAQLHFRGGRFGTGCKRMGYFLRYSPLSLFRARTLRILFNAFFNRLGHRFFAKLLRLK